MSKHVVCAIARQNQPGWFDHWTKLRRYTQAATSPCRRGKTPGTIAMILVFSRGPAEVIKIRPRSANEFPAGRSPKNAFSH
jgi:hypothetical protein